MTHAFRISLIALFASLLAACAAGWSKVEKPLARDNDETFSVKLPKGWMRAGFYREGIVVTRDGPGIQWIEVARRDHDKAFPKIEKKSSAEMLPSELAERMIAELKSQQNVDNLEVVENAPADIGGRKGFRLHLRYRNGQGLRLERIIYGFADDGGFFYLGYQAPTLYYFSRDLPAFKKVVESFSRSAG